MTRKAVHDLQNQHAEPNITDTSTFGSERSMARVSLICLPVSESNIVLTSPSSTKVTHTILGLIMHQERILSEIAKEVLGLVFAAPRTFWRECGGATPRTIARTNGTPLHAVSLRTQEPMLLSGT